MAVKDSEELKSDERYPLGEYSFRIERSSVPGSTNDKIEAICTKDGKNARKSIQLPSSTQLDGWYVEANETEATVYAVVEKETGGDEKTSTNPVVGGTQLHGTIFAEAVTNVTNGDIDPPHHIIRDLKIAPGTFSTIRDVGIVASETESYTTDLNGNSVVWCIHTENTQTTGNSWSTYTVDGKTVYFATISGQWGVVGNVDVLRISGVPESSVDGTNGQVAWAIIYNSTSSGGEMVLEEILVGRFAIDIEDAGGVGPGSDWVDPGDYDEDWEPEELTHTLYVEVTGALSGRHNDPIVDPSYSYIPADKDTVKDYGCGGDGGHGGGGGAGSSTVVIHKFATNQANSKEVTAIARRHGYGSGGGKGGKGGDGCILVYY